MSDKFGWFAEGDVVVYCMSCDWKSDRIQAEHDCPNSIKNLTARAERAEALLRRIEFAGVAIEPGLLISGRCPCCQGGPTDARHAEWMSGDCELSAILHGAP